MKNFLSENIKKLRSQRGMSQDKLAEQMNVTPQAVSKWECEMSYPDVEMLFELADFFGVTVDFLFKGESESPSEKNENTVINELPDDGIFRIVQCKGNKVIKQGMLKKAPSFSLYTEGMEKLENVAIEVWGDADIKGNVNGNIEAGCDIVCGDVLGNVTAGCDADIKKGDVHGNATAGCDLHCGNVGKNATAGCDIRCGDICGNAFAGSDITSKK